MDPNTSTSGWTDTAWLDADDPELAELSRAEDTDELCRRLLQPACGLRGSSRCAEAVDLLAGVHGSGTLPASLVALLLCTCRRWQRVTAKLIAGLEASGLLNGAELDELAEWLLGDEVVVEYPLTWVSSEWLEIDPSDGTTRAVTVDEDLITRSQRRSEPPLRRWGASRALCREPGRLDELVACAEPMEPRHGDALLHGLLDAADVLQVDDRRRLIWRGLDCGIGRVRRAALDRLCELDGQDAAYRRASSDPDRTVRAWRPAEPAEPAEPQLPL